MQTILHTWSMQNTGSDRTESAVRFDSLNYDTCQIKEILSLETRILSLNELKEWQMPWLKWILNPCAWPPIKTLAHTVSYSSAQPLLGARMSACQAIPS